MYFVIKWSLGRCFYLLKNNCFIDICMDIMNLILK